MAASAMLRDQSRSSSRQIEPCLTPQPRFRTPPAGRLQPRCHIRGNRAVAVNDATERLAIHSQLLRRRGHAGRATTASRVRSDAAGRWAGTARRDSGPSSAPGISRRRRTCAGLTPRESPQWNSRSAAPRLKLRVAKPSVDQDKVRSSSDPGGTAQSGGLPGRALRRLRAGHAGAGFALMIALIRIIWPAAPIRNGIPEGAWRPRRGSRLNPHGILKSLLKRGQAPRLRCIIGLFQWARASSSASSAVPS